MAKPKGSNKENLERTRQHLLRVARSCFATAGFHRTSTTKVIEQAGSSRGSLYHHFPDKKALFQAVYDQLSQEIGEIIAANSHHGNTPIEELINGCVVYLEIFADQAFAQVVLIDGPNVLGMDYYRGSDSETSYSALAEGVADFVEDPVRVRLLADFLSGALDTYALRIAMADDREQAVGEYTEAFRELAGRVLA
jgi:AcrR family transcriptional regulator